MMIMIPKTQLAGLILIAATITSVSCKKADVKSKQKTKTELLTEGTWKKTSLTSTPAYDWYGDGDYATDILSIMDVCELDDFDTYRSDGSGDTNGGTMRCNQSDPQAWPFTWALTDNETKLVFNGVNKLNLVELTETTLKFSTTFEENGITYTQEETYGH
jgi:hypothetical protein